MAVSPLRWLILCRFLAQRNELLHSSSFGDGWAEGQRLLESVSEPHHLVAPKMMLHGLPVVRVQGQSDVVTAVAFRIEDVNLEVSIAHDRRVLLRGLRHGPAHAAKERSHARATSSVTRARRRRMQARPERDAPRAPWRAAPTIPSL